MVKRLGLTRLESVVVMEMRKLEYFYFTTNYIQGLVPWTRDP
jgi:hypothetical protein